MKSIQEVQHQGVLWVNVTRQAAKELAEVRKRFDFEKSDIDEALPPYQRPKMVKRRDYYFIVLQFPVFDRKTKRLGFTEIDIFLSANFLVTVHDNSLPHLESFFEECKKSAEIRAEYFGGTAAHVLFEVLTRLEEAIFPSLLHINEDINTVDKDLFTTTHERRMAGEILRLKNNIVTFRRTMQGHRIVLDRFIMRGGRDLQLAQYQNYINSLREAIEEIWNMLESQKESINTLHETNESILSLRTNEVMRTLTVISVITFPLTLLAAVFSIHAPGTPFLDSQWGFAIIVTGMVVLAAAMITVFKYKKWL